MILYIYINIYIECSIYIYVDVVLIAIVITMSVYSLNSYFLCVFVGLFWIPQIIVRVREGCKSIPNWAFIIPLTLQHSFITVYCYILYIQYIYTIYIALHIFIR